MKIPSALSLVVASVLTTGCAGAPKSPQQSDLSRAAVITGDCQLDFSRARAIAGDNDTVVMVDGYSGAVAGGVKGAGIGLFGGTLTCAATGFLFAPCMGILVPITTASGAMGGAAGGALNSESADDMAAKRGMLTEALNALVANQRLVSLVEQKMLGAEAVESPAMEKTQITTVPEWTLRTALTELATVGSGPDKRYLLQASATLEVVRAGEGSPCFVKNYRALSPVKMSTTAWRANHNVLARTTLDDLLAKLATDMLNDLSPIQLSPDKTLVDYMVLEKPTDADSVTKQISVISSEEKQDSNSAAKESDSDSPSHLFDPTTGTNWVVVDSSPVDLSTANNICKTLDTGDKRKYRVPSLREFEELWERYKNDQSISIFKRREYSAESKDESPRLPPGYTKTFSFASGNSGQLYAAYLTCVRD